MTRKGTESRRRLVPNEPTTHNLLEEASAIDFPDNRRFLAFLKRGLGNFPRRDGWGIGVFSTQWTISLLKHQDSKQQIFINTLFVDAFLPRSGRTNLFSRLRSFDRAR